MIDKSKKGGKIGLNDLLLGSIVLAFVSISVLWLGDNHIQKVSWVRLTALEQSLSDVAPTLSAAGISSLTFDSMNATKIRFGAGNSLPVAVPVSVRESGFPARIDVHADSLVIIVKKTTPLPSSFDDAETFIRLLAEHSIAAIQSHQQYGLQPINK